MEVEAAKQARVCQFVHTGCECSMILLLACLLAMLYLPCDLFAEHCKVVLNKLSQYGIISS